MSDDRRGRRIHQRFECELPVRLNFTDSDGEAKVLETRALNVSLGGMFVADAMNVPFGGEGTLSVHLPKLDETVEIAVTVRWITDEGAGVQFGSLRAREVWGLNELFDKLKGSTE